MSKQIQKENERMVREIDTIMREHGASRITTEHTNEWLVDLPGIGKVSFTHFTREGSNVFSLYARPSLNKGPDEANKTTVNLVALFGSDHVNQFTGKWNIHEDTVTGVLRVLIARLSRIDFTGEIVPSEEETAFVPSPDWVELKDPKQATFALCAGCGKVFHGEGFRERANGHAEAEVEKVATVLRTTDRPFIVKETHTVRWCAEVCPEGVKPLNIPLAVTGQLRGDALGIGSDFGLGIQMTSCKGVVVVEGVTVWVHKDGDRWKCSAYGHNVGQGFRTRADAIKNATDRIQASLRPTSHTPWAHAVAYCVARMRLAWLQGEIMEGTPADYWESRASRITA